MMTREVTAKDRGSQDLQALVQAKQKEIGAKLASLQREVTSNPIKELAQKKPLTVVAIAAGAGFLVALLFRRKGEKVRPSERDELAGALASIIADAARSRGGNVSESSRESLVEAVEKLPQVQARGQSESRMSSFWGSFLGAFTRNLVRDLLSAIFSTHTGEADEAKGQGQEA